MKWYIGIYRGRDGRIMSTSPFRSPLAVKGSVTFPIIDIQEFMVP